MLSRCWLQCVVQSWAVGPVCVCGSGKRNLISRPSPKTQTGVGVVNDQESLH